MGMTPELYSEIRESFKKSLPAIHAGKDQQPICYAATGKLENWDRPPIMEHGPTMKQIRNLVLQIAEMDLAEYSCRRRNLTIVRVRQIIVILGREFRPGLTLHQLGRFMDRDHSTIIHALRSWDVRYNHDLKSKSIYNMARRRISAGLYNVAAP